MGQILYNPARAAAAMDEAGLDALLAVTAPNVQYLTRFRRAGSGLALVRRSELTQPELYVSASNISFVLEDPLDTLVVRPFGRFFRNFTQNGELSEREEALKRMHESTCEDKSSWDLIAASLSDSGLQNGVIGVDGTADSAAKLQALLPNARIKSVPDLFRWLRMIKSADEIARLAEAARVTEHAIITSAQSAFLGATQRHLARVFSQTAIAANCFVRQDNASIDGGSAFGNLNTPGDVVVDGSIIRYDVGVHYEGYASDIARCFSFRTVRDKVRRYQDALVAGQERMLECVRPGAIPADIFHEVVKTVRKEGIPHFDRTHVGHGIGIAGAGYEPPLLAPGDETPLQPGMVLCVETPYTEVGFGGLQVEDMLVVTDSGYRLLTHSERRIQVVP